jgi:hypothetical protein
VLRRSCLVGIALSYLPTLALLAAIGTGFVCAGAAGVAFWFLIVALTGYAWVFLWYRAAQLRHRGSR